MRRSIITSLCFSLLFIYISCEEQSITAKSNNPAPVIGNDNGDVSGDDSDAGNENNDEEKIEKATGIYASMISGSDTQNPIVTHAQSNGGLIRTTWNKIETSDQVFDFSSIDNQLAIIEKNNHNKPEFKFSLAISAGCGSITSSGYPLWMDARTDIDKWTIKFRDNTCTNMPKGWDQDYLDELKEFAEALALKYGKDDRLTLIYVPQTTGNGIEGHFNGNFKDRDVHDWTPLTDQGLNEETWVKAMKEASLIFADAFKNKAIAIELHEVIDTHIIPLKAVDEIYNDPRSEGRVGIAMWWMFGKFEHSELMAGFKNFKGDVYGQVGANSKQIGRFGGCGYDSIFDLAIDLNMRYIEPWDTEFKLAGTHGIDQDSYNTQVENFKKFNEYVSKKFLLGEDPAKPIFTIINPTVPDPNHDPTVTGKPCPARYDES
ncbi:MAG: hypothetical protein HON90_12780 [Halobacteriovoraceae bacterium]|jgi:hypothetical protein|nr:hypothetical protein [Halobacteriovoraceae bacterium]